MHFESTYAVRGGLGALRNLDPVIVLRFSMSISTLQRSVMSTRTRSDPGACRSACPRKAVQYTNLGSFSGMLDGSAGHRTHH